MCLVSTEYHIKIFFLCLLLFVKMHHRGRPATARPYTQGWNSAHGLTMRPSSATKYSLFSPLTPRAEKKTLFSKLSGGASRPSTARPQSAFNRRLSSRLGGNSPKTSDSGASHSRPASAKVACESFKWVLI